MKLSERIKFHYAEAEENGARNITTTLLIPTDLTGLSDDLVEYGAIAALQPELKKSLTAALAGYLQEADQLIRKMFPTPATESKGMAGQTAKGKTRSSQGQPDWNKLINVTESTTNQDSSPVREFTCGISLPSKLTKWADRFAAQGVVKPVRTRLRESLLDAAVAYVRKGEELFRSACQGPVVEVDPVEVHVRVTGRKGRGLSVGMALEMDGVVGVDPVGDLGDEDLGLHV